MATMIKTIFLDSLQPENQEPQGHPEITSPTAVISSPSCVVLYTTTSKPVGQPTSISIILSPQQQILCNKKITIATC